MAVEQFVFEARNIFACIRPIEQVRKRGPKAFRKTKTRVLSIMPKIHFKCAVLSMRFID